MKKKRDAAILLLLLGANVHAQTSKAKTPLTVEKYTVDEGIKNIITLISELNNEANQILRQNLQRGAAAAHIPFSTYPNWQREAPMLIGRIREVSEKTWRINLEEFYAAHPLLNAIVSLIQTDQTAQAAVANVVIHISPVKQRPTAARDVDIQNYSTPRLIMPPEIKEKMRGDIKPEECITLSQEEIMYHAKLRIQFAFYLLVAYYKSRINLVFTATKDQEGKGEADIRTVACHSALISDIDEQFRWKAGIEITEQMKSSRSNSESLASLHVPKNSFFATSLRKTIMECNEAELAAHCEPHFHELQQEIITNRI